MVTIVIAWTMTKGFAVALGAGSVVKGGEVYVEQFAKYRERVATGVHVLWDYIISNAILR